MTEKDRRETTWRRLISSPLPAVFIGLTVVNIVILALATKVRYSSSDAAGNGMSNGLQAAYVMVGGVAVVVIALLFGVIRYRPLRIALTILQGLTMLKIVELLP